MNWAQEMALAPSGGPEAATTDVAAATRRRDLQRLPVSVGLARTRHARAAATGALCSLISWFMRNRLSLSSIVFNAASRS
jgi:hypothetical protein